MMTSPSHIFAKFGKERPVALVAWTIVVGTLIRFGIAYAEIDLSNTEAYYIATARHFALSYFDHPGLSFWIAGLGMKLAGSDSLVAVRAPFIILFGGTTWLMYRLGAELFDRQTGALAALLLNLSFLFTFSFAAWVQPDGVLIFMLLAAMLCLVRIDRAQTSRQRFYLWMAMGVFLGLATLTKYYAVLLPLGLLIFVLTSAKHRPLLAEPGPYLGAIIAVVLFTPALAWNWQNNWISFGFQSVQRFEDSKVGIAPVLESIGGQALLITPWIWLPLIDAAVRGFARGPNSWRLWLLAIVGTTPVLLFTLAAIWIAPGGHFHWEGIGYLMLFPALAYFIELKLRRGDALARRWLFASAATVLLLVPIAASAAATGWFWHLLPESFAHAHGDPTLKGLRWAELRTAVRSRGLLGQNHLFVVGVDRGDSAKIDFELGGDNPVVCLCGDPRNFAFSWNPDDFQGWNALIVVGGDSDQPQISHKGFFRKIELLQTVEIWRGGEIVHTLRIYYATDFYRSYPLALRIHAHGDSVPAH